MLGHHFSTAHDSQNKIDSKEGSFIFTWQLISIEGYFTLEARKGCSTGCSWHPHKLDAAKSYTMHL